MCLANSTWSFPATQKLCLSISHLFFIASDFLFDNAMALPSKKINRKGCSVAKKECFKLPQRTLNSTFLNMLFSH